MTPRSFENHRGNHLRLRGAESRGGSDAYAIEDSKPWKADCWADLNGGGHYLTFHSETPLAVGRESPSARAKELQFRSILLNEWHFLDEEGQGV
jgi:hypothetical protein